MNTPLIVAAIFMAGIVAVSWWWKRVDTTTFNNLNPGDIVWAAVRYQEKRTVKDRPVVIVGHRRGRHIALYATSQSKNSHRPGVVNIGAGNWDRQSRDTFVDTRRQLSLKPSDIRRHGGRLDPAVFADVRREWKRQR